MHSAQLRFFLVKIFSQSFVLHHQDRNSGHGLRNDVLFLHAWGIHVDLLAGVDRVIPALKGSYMTFFEPYWTFELEKMGYRR